MTKVSVIIPAYNAAKTVERTVRSVLASTIPLDIWVVDDGSTDGTGDLLDRMEREFVSVDGSRLVVMHQPNCGAYQARLNALKRMETPYFGFVDADDTVSPNMFEKMLVFAERESLDVVQCGYETDGSVEYLGLDGMVLDGRAAVYREYVYPKLLDSRESSYIWDKLYRNKYDFNAFDETNHVTNFDDLIFNFHFFLQVERMGFLDEPLYHYAETEGSAVHSYGDNKIKDYQEAWRIRSELSPIYGMSADNLVMHSWTLLNARNGIIAAATAKGISICERARLVKKVVMLPFVIEAQTKVGLHGGASFIVMIARFLPGIFLVYLVQTAKVILKK